MNDDDLIQYAKSNKAFNSVYKIDFKLGSLKRRSVASCVHIGEGVFITDAHCLLPFSSKGERLKYKLFVSSDKSSFSIEDIAIRPEYKDFPRKTRSQYDFALFYVQGAQNFSYSVPHYYSPYDMINKFSKKTQKFEKSIVSVVGYGVSGGGNSVLAKMDGKKRAVRAQLEYVRIRSEADKYPPLCSLHHFELDENSKPREREPLNYEAGTRVGMSGGGVFNENNELIALYKGQSREIKNLKEYMVWKARRLVKKFSILTYVPFQILKKDDSSIYTPLKYHKDFIEKTRKNWLHSNDQNLDEDQDLDDELDSLEGE